MEQLQVVKLERAMANQFRQEAHRNLPSACRLRARLRAKAAQPVPAARIAQLEAEVGNLVEAVASGALRGSPVLAERLKAAESELARLKPTAAPRPGADVERLIPDIAQRVLRGLERLPESLATASVTKSRQEWSEKVGPITVEADEQEIRFYNEKGHLEAALLRAVGATANNCGSGGRI